MAVLVLTSSLCRTDTAPSCDLKLRKVYLVSIFKLSTLIADLGEVVVVGELSVVLCCEEVGFIMIDVWVIADVKLLSDWLLISEGKTPNFVVDAKSLVELGAKIPVFNMVLLRVKLPVIDMEFGDGWIEVVFVVDCCGHFAERRKSIWIIQYRVSMFKSLGRNHACTKCSFQRRLKSNKS